MSSTSGILNLGLLVIVCMVLVSAPKAKADVTCGEVVRLLTPCASYLASGGAVPPTCCTGITSLNTEAKTTTDRQTVCKCLESAVSGVPYTAFNVGLATGLPAKCGVNIPYNLSPSTNCNSIK